MCLFFRLVHGVSGKDSVSFGSPFSNFFYNMTKLWPNWGYKRKRILYFRSFWTTYKILLYPWRNFVNKTLLFLVGWYCLLYVFLRLLNMATMTNRTSKIWPNYDQLLVFFVERLVCLALVGKKYFRMGINHKTIGKKKNDIIIMCCI